MMKARIVVIFWADPTIVIWPVHSHPDRQKGLFPFAGGYNRYNPKTRYLPISENFLSRKYFSIQYLATGWQKCNCFNGHRRDTLSS